MCSEVQIIAVDFDLFCTDPSKPYQCWVCKKKYSSNGSFRYHLNYGCVKPPQFKCHHCHVAFKHRISLKSHVWCKHGERLERKESRRYEL
ncbi:hypothetical protein JTB14_010326 [Gonioctena quinquepunctata]|nr:hypothetical protein JTB14_010326 [Gonioctena quinquepunctata]